MSNVVHLMPENVPPSDEDHGLIGWRLRQVEGTVRDLDNKVDRLIWAVTAAAISFACSAAVILITYLNAHPR